jgi:hypothetical protein
MTNKNAPFGVIDIQKAYLVGRNENLELGGAGTHLYSEIRSSLDIPKLNEALNKVIVRHPILHTVFNLENQQQVILGEIPVYNINYLDISSFSKNRQGSLIKEEREKLSHLVFDPSAWSLFELKIFKRIINHVTHHNPKGKSNPALKKNRVARFVY